MVINVIAEQASLSDETAVQLDGETAPGPTTEQLRQMTLAEALAPVPGHPAADTHPAVVMGGGILPAPLLAAKVADTAAIRSSIPATVRPSHTTYRRRRWPGLFDAGI